MRVLGAIVLAAVLGGCTSVKMVQRDGCWVRRTEKIFGRVQEEVGPCSRPQPEWAQDRLTRVVQECVAQADYRWQGRAMEAWSKGLPFPAQPPQEETARACMEEARTGLVTENERLKQQVGELARDREALRAQSEHDRAQLRSANERLGEHLGEAAKKPAGTAYATSNSSSDGRAVNENGASLAESGSGAPSSGGPPSVPAVPAATVAGPGPSLPVVAPRPEAVQNAQPASPPKARRPARPAPRASPAPRCEPAATCTDGRR